MRQLYSIIALTLHQICAVHCQSVMKSSLTFVIDNTTSMKADKKGVIKGVKEIFKVALNTSGTLIEKYNIVTFNDPDTSVVYNNTDRTEFINSLTHINMSGGGDCPEMAMTGIEKGLRLSYPFSYIFVFTDAEEKDSYKFEEVKNLALNLNTKITFVISKTICGKQESNPDFSSYKSLAKNTSGQFFYLKKGDVHKVLDYVKTVIEDRKMELHREEILANEKKNVDVNIDSTINQVDVSLVGSNPTLHVNDEAGNKVEFKNILNISSAKVVAFNNSNSGTYRVSAGIESDGELMIVCTTNISFQYGFSIIKPTSMDDTTNRPIRGRKSFVSIKLITKGEKVNLLKIRLLNLKNNVILEQPMWIVDGKKQFYISEPINPPKDTFKIEIIAVNEKTKEEIKRVSDTPVEPQNISFDPIENKAPVVNITGKSKIMSEYGSPLQLKCFITGYPEPEILWEDESGLLLNFEVSPKRLPYEFISVLEIDHITRAHTFSCKASNDFGSNAKIVKVEAVDHFEVVNISKDKIVEYNKEETLLCKVNANPPANITWYRNGEEIVMDDDISISPDGSSLLIKHMKPKLAGKIICKVQNGINSGIYNIQLSVTGIDVPKIDKNITEISVKMGYNVDIPCRILKGNPMPTIQWFFKGENKEVFNKIKQSNETLHLESVTTNMVGAYKCVAGNEIDQDTHVTDLVVEYPIENKAPVVNIIGNSKVISNYGNSLQLKCIITGYPKPKILWKDALGSLMIFKVTSKKEPYEFISVLEIDNVTQTNTYFCTAINDFGSDEKIIKVETKPYFEVISISKDKNVEYKKEGTLFCKVNAYPPANVTWYRNGEEIVMDDDISMSPDRSTLFIKRMKPKFAGKIICEVRNDMKRSTYNMQLSVTGIDVPKIDKNTTEIYAKKGSNIDIPCRILKGNPVPTIQWFFKAANKEVFNEIKEYSENIHIGSVTTNMVGTYKCIAKNEINQDSHVIDLDIAYSPVIKQDIKIIQKQSGELVKIPCQVDGTSELEVVWYLNETKINDDDTYRIYRDNTLKFMATIEKNGRYTCKASNKFGSTNKTTTVIIFIPASIEKPEEMVLKVKIGSKVFLSCKVNGYPPPRVKWYFSSIKENRTRIIDVNGPLYIPVIQLKDEGIYLCKAKNIYEPNPVGLAYFVYIYAPPSIITEPNAKTIIAVVDDISVRIPCWVTGSPKPKIRWSKGGKLLTIGDDWYSVDINGTLIIKNIKKAMAGKYVCSAENDYSSFYEEYSLTVEASPRCQVKNVKYFEEDKPAEAECNISHHSTDVIRWYKGNKKVADGKLLFPRLEKNHVGLYKCRVSNFIDTQTDCIFINIGYKPRFTFKDDTLSHLFYNENRNLRCPFRAAPKAKITWWFNKIEISNNHDVLEYDRKVSSIGEYICVVENTFGKIEKKFNVTANGCVLNIQIDFDRNHPLVLTESFQLPNFYIVDSHFLIPINERVQFFCSEGFNYFPSTEVKAACIKNKVFQINEKLIEYPKLKCKDAMHPITKQTKRACARGDGEIFEIGIFVKEFLEVYKVCFDKKLKVPRYAEYSLSAPVAGVQSMPSEAWFDNEFISYNVTEMYDCKQQKIDISTTMGRPFHDEETWCFSPRQLVNEKDVSPGLPQISTHSYLNVIPHWSSDRMNNWDNLEELIRSAVNKTNCVLHIITGISQTLVLPVGTSNVKVHIKDKAGTALIVPIYLWKVIIDEVQTTSVAIIQINVPHITISDVHKYEICPDICNEINWMRTMSRKINNGYIICCNIHDFEKAFSYNKEFTKGFGYRVLKDFESYAVY